jgi:hypothetical protein
MRFTEKRAARRQRVLKSGSIRFNADSSTIDCTVRDLSSTGGALRVVSLVGIPEDFHLAIAGDGVHHCRVVWRAKDRLGVKFVA